MMKSCKKLAVIILVMAVALAGSVPSMALPADKTVHQKADALNSLKIITGTNGEYNLGNSLRRSEAVTYIVRLIGKADHVVANKGLYSITPYSDVASNQWYAPYFGYCAANGIISKDSKRIDPLGYISDREFVKLVLIALEYREGIDFTADTIFEKAKDIGLTNLTYYVNHLRQNTTTTRSGAVELMYAALSLKLRTGEKFLYQKLIDEKVATRKQLTALGFIEDKPATDIQKITTIDLNKLEIKFNENISLLSGIKIYSKDNANDVLGCSIQSLAGDTLTVLTSAIDLNKEYTVELTGVQDEKENVVDRVAKNFKGFEAREVKSNYFRISKIEAVNDKSIKVYFTHPVTLNSEVCLYYSVLKDSAVIADGKQGAIKAGLLNTEKNAVLLSLNNTSLTTDSLYTLNIDGNMVSAYGAKMNNGLGDSMKFAAVGKEALRFELEQIAAVDKKTVLLSFSKEVNPFLAQQIFNFYLTDENNNPIRISTTAINDAGRGVYLILGQDMDKSKKYWLTVNNLNDVTRQEYITEQKYGFQADFGTTEGFMITKINTVDNQTVEFFFSKPLDAAAAMRLSSYSVIRVGNYGMVPPEKVFYDPATDPYMVRLFFSKANSLSASYDYEIRIDSSMKDYLGNSVSIAGARFSGSGQQRADIAIESVVPVSGDTVKVTFTKEIAFSASNLLPSGFALEYTYNKNSIRKLPAGVLYVNAKTLAIKFDALEPNTAYKLKAVSLVDYLGNTVKGLEKTFEFKPE